MPRHECPGGHFAVGTTMPTTPAVGLLPTSGPEFSARTIISGKFGPGGPKFSAIILVPDQNYRGPIVQ